MKTDRIFNMVMVERAHQDQKHGTIEENPHTLPEWLLIMEKELEEAKQAYFSDSWGLRMTKNILNIVAVGFAALEQHIE